ncbi:MAG TPA: TssN family type VI secretion system protein [Puia sp.]|nr:TssN family type VI secretion system protein [Puia sp.]
MEKVINNELAKLLIVLGALTVGLAAVLAKMIEKVQGTFKPYRKATLLYMICGLLFFAIVACAAYPGFFSSSTGIFVFFQAYFLLLGVAHYYFMHQYLLWSVSKKAFWLELVFTLLIGLFGSISFLLIYHFVNRNGLQYVMAGSIVFFLIPFFFYQTFQTAIGIPPKILKEWFYPVKQEMEEPEDSKMKNLLVISFEFQKMTNDPHFTNFRAKAPVDMDMGQLFYFFINDYNERHPSSRIEFVNPSGEPHGWIFYKKSRWYSILTKYMDAEKTIYSNHIKENDVIICTRSLI